VGGRYKPVAHTLWAPSGGPCGGWYVRIDNGRRCCRGIAHATEEEAWACWHGAASRRCEVCDDPTGTTWKRLCLACWKLDRASGPGTARAHFEALTASRRAAAGRQLPPPHPVPVVIRRHGAPLTAAELEAAERVRRSLGDAPPW